MARTEDGAFSMNVELTIAGTAFEAVWQTDNLALVLRRDAGTDIVIREDGPALANLRRGELAEPTLAFLAAHLMAEDPRVAQARAATAEQLWAEYNGSWRAAGDTDATDEAAFGIALGHGRLDFLVDETGLPSLAEMWWQNTALFLGHSILVQIYEPHDWRSFDATIFG